MDNFTTLSQRLLNRAPQIGIVLAGQLVNDAWRTLQARRDWSWRRRSHTFAPPTLYQEGAASTNSAIGSPTLVTGVNTTWTSDMIGRQIRIGGLLYPYYTIIGWLSATAILIDQPWAGTDVTNGPYQILKCYFEVPSDFGYWEVVASLKDSYRVYHQATEDELALYDPQRTNQGQTYGIAFFDFSSTYGGVVGPVIPVTSPTSPSPISTTTSGYSYPASATFIVQVVTGGVTGVATFQWIRAGQTSFQPTIITDTSPQDLSDGVQVYWPDTQTYVSGDLFVINCIPMITEGVPRYEFWPAPTYSQYLYSSVYFAKEFDLTPQAPTLPPPIANRGEVLLELALEKCAQFPGQDLDHANPYYSLQLAKYHFEKSEMMIEDLLSNDQNIAISNISYESFPFLGPWADGGYRQSHSPYLNG